MNDPTPIQYPTHVAQDLVEENRFISADADGSTPPDFQSVRERIPEPLLNDEDALAYDGTTWTVLYDGSAEDADWAAADLDAVTRPEPGFAT